MAWQPPRQGAPNPNAQPWGYNNNNQQQGGYNQQQQQQPGGYYPQQGGYQQQQGGYYPQQQGNYNQQGYNNNQQGWNQHQQQGGYNPNAGAYYPPGMQQQNQYQQQPRFADPQPAPEQPPAPAPTAADQSKLTLGGAAKKEEIVLPKRTGGAKKLVLGKKKTEEPKPEEKPSEEAKPAEEKPAAEEAKPVSSPTETKPAEEEKKETTKPEPTASAKAPKSKRAQKEYVRDPRPHFNVVFCGHVDAGKSTVSGRILAEAGIVDEREMDKLRREAEQKHREGWEYAYVMDVSEEERAKGKTHETGAAYFETTERRITILDAPGHKAFVPSMIGGAAQADVAVMIISARTGEFETGFERGGQTREHTTLLRTCGVKHMICAINKMDDANWDKERYDDILTKLTPFFQQNGFQPTTDDKKKMNAVVHFMPCSGLTGKGITKQILETDCPWYRGPSLVEYINTLTLPGAKSDEDPLCVPVVGAFKDDGKVFVYGKVEAGSIVAGDELVVLPLKKTVTVESVAVEMTEIEKAYPGDNVHVRIKGMDETEFHSGFVLTSTVPPSPLRSVEFFLARVVVLEDVKNIICAGSKCMMHIHSATEEVSFHFLAAKLDRKTSKVIEEKPTFAKAGEVVMARMEVQLPLTVETSKNFDKLGRFMLRDEGKTIGIGLVEKLYESTHDQMKSKSAGAKAE